MKLLQLKKFNKISFKYLDNEGEEVTFSSNEEWIDVIENFKGEILKITVVSVEKKSESKSETKSETKNEEKIDLSQLFQTFQPFISQFTNNNNGFDFSQIFGGLNNQQSGFDFNKILQMFTNKDQKEEFNFEDILKKFSCHKKKDCQEKKRLSRKRTLQEKKRKL